MSCAFDQTKFLIYSKYYAMTADAGVEAANALSDMMTYTNELNPSDFLRQDNQRSALANFQGVIGSAYAITTEFARDLTPMESAFKQLSIYIQNVTGSTVTNYVYNNGIVVENSYGQIANQLGESIPSGNIKALPECN